MAENPSAATAATEQATAPEAAAQPEQAAAPVDYNAFLDQVPEEILLRHRRFNGYAGQVGERLYQQRKKTDDEESWTKAQRAKEEELEREAEENPFAFSQKWLKGRAEERAKTELADLRTKAQRDLFAKIGQSYGALPEWQHLTPEEFAKVQQSVTGVSDDELVAKFNVAALDVLADRRAEQRISERLGTEVEARVQQALADRLRSETVPNMSAPASTNGLSDISAIRGMTDAQFKDFYDKTFRT